MSKLSQSKREAKRLLNLATETQNQLTIPNLSTAQKIIAYTNGFKNWHDFEVNLNKEKINTPEIEIYEHLSPENVHILKNLYIDDIELHINEYDLDYQYKMIENTNQDNLLKPIGYITEKSLFKEQQKDIQYYKKNHIMVGSAGSGKSEVLKFMIEDFSNESCVFFSIYEGINLYQKLSVCKKMNISDVYYVSLLPNNKTSHSIDLINPLIDLEVGFKKSFTIDNILLSDIFYKLSKYYQKLNKALDSKNLRTFLSLNWLANFNKQPEIENLIDKYFQEINIVKEQVKEESFFNNSFTQIQQHHKNCHVTQIILEQMSKYEKKGVFSKEPQIDFVRLLESKKHIIFDLHSGHTENNGSHHSELVKFIYMNYFHVLKDRNEFLTNNIHENIDTGYGFSAVTITEYLTDYLDDKAYTILNDILQSRKSPIFISEQSLDHIKPKYHSLLNHIDYYLFLRCDFNSDYLIPEMCKKMMMEGKSGFKNIAKYALDIKDLKLGEAYYWTNTHESNWVKNKWKDRYFDLLKIKLKYSYSNYHNNKSNKQIINHQSIKKIKI